MSTLFIVRKIQYSITCATYVPFMVQSRLFKLLTIELDYGQKHIKEIGCYQLIVQSLYVFYLERNIIWESGWRSSCRYSLDLQYSILAAQD